MRSYNKWFLSVGLLWAILFSVQVPSVYAATQIDSVVAVVNDDIITQGELNQQLALNQRAMEQTGTKAMNASELRSYTLNQLIDQKVMDQMIKRYRLKVTPEETDKAIQNIASTNNMSLDQLKQALKAQGMGWSQYQTEIHKQLLYQKLFDEVVGSQVSINDAEVDKVMSSPEFTQSHITAYHLGDILIPLPDNPTPEEVASAQASAQAAVKALQQGKSLDDVAAQYGDTSTNPTDLGWRAPSDLPSVFLDAASTMKVGDVHAPIQTGNGWHVIKLIDIQGQAAGEHSTTQTHARHILIKAPHKDDDGPVKAELEKIRQDALHGGDFAALAQKYSQDPGSAVKGGDLGWVTPGEMVAPFEAAMNQTPVGQISEPVKTQFGWHIIQVLARKDVNDTQDYKQMMAKNFLFQQKLSKAKLDWLARMRQDSYIKIMPTSDNNGN